MSVSSYADALFIQSRIQTTLKVLIADDFYTNRLQVKIVLQAMGFIAEEAENGMEVIRQLENHTFSLILMDIEMPVMNGLETTQYIREQMSPDKSKTPVVAITAHNPEEYFDNFKKHGFDGLITKPVTKEKIARVIREALPDSNYK